MLKAVITSVELTKESWFVNCYSDFICSISRPCVKYGKRF